MQNELQRANCTSGVGFCFILPLLGPSCPLKVVSAFVGACVWLFASSRCLLRLVRVVLRRVGSSCALYVPSCGASSRVGEAVGAYVAAVGPPIDVGLPKPNLRASEASLKV